MMSFITIDIVGYVAGFLIAIAFIPQAVKSIRTKDTKAISMPTQVIYLCACVLWLTYGVLLDNWPMMFWNAVTSLVAMFVIAAKLKYG